MTKPFLLRRREPAGTHEEIGLTWYEFSRFHPDRFVRRYGIPMAFVATHNHFILDRGGKVFNRSAPAIRLPEAASEEEHLRLVGLLNSSTACFWLKQVSHNKGSSVDQRGARQTTVEWENFYEFTATKLTDYPLPDGAPVDLATRLDGLAQELGTVTPVAVCESGVPTRHALDAAHERWQAIRAEMVSAQEELDWEVYDLYGLLGDDADALIGKDVTKPPLQLGERAFEIGLARRMAAGEVETQWFSRHRSTPITQLPAHWSPDYRALVERRLVFTAADPYLHLIERPECKRRWQSEPWEKQESEALANWLLDRLENRRLWFTGDDFPRLRTVAQLADEVRTDPDFGDVAALYARDVDITAVVTALVKDQHVPFLAAWRYTDTGMDKRQVWERTWELQRREDAGEHVGTIAVPPKYKQADFRAGSYWRLRGKLDVPKEWFTSYLDASRDGTLLLGWAGFDHLQRAQALAAYVGERIELDGWAADRLTPLLAGLAELLPWVRQWHDEPDPAFGQRPADAYQGVLDGWLHALDLTPDDLARWRPPTASRGRRSRAEPRGR
ncbi:MAG TPA: BREX-2 system adenine-specific DNA-methyltransferase PglX [Mycobacteriales bacterium]|nr:BREX-2 system adenine-specific DNA-methyltransferase PglX [Mycobacteriales bacterium]